MRTGMRRGLSRPSRKRRLKQRECRRKTRISTLNLWKATVQTLSGMSAYSESSRRWPLPRQTRAKAGLLALGHQRQAPRCMTTLRIH